MSTRHVCHRLRSDVGDDSPDVIDDHVGAGFLQLENGIFIFGLLLVEAMPFLVEVGVLLDLFVGIFVLSIIIHHINREFSSQDTRRLSLLKE